MLVISTGGKAPGMTADTPANINFQEHVLCRRHIERGSLVGHPVLWEVVFCEQVRSDPALEAG